MYGEGVKKRYRLDEKIDEMEIEGMLKKFVLGGVVLREILDFNVAEAGDVLFFLLLWKFYVGIVKSFRNGVKNFVPISFLFSKYGR